jgi:hypothetical protein
MVNVLVPNDLELTASALKTLAKSIDTSQFQNSEADWELDYAEHLSTAVQVQSHD